MKNQFELSYKDLKSTCNPNIFKFETTESLEPIASGIGQDRGIKALEFGLNVDINGYNLYIEGPSGVGKTSYTKNYLQTIAKKKKVPSDWCYVYNFDIPNEPIAIELPAGRGHSGCTGCLRNCGRRTEGDQSFLQGSKNGPGCYPDLL